MTHKSIWISEASPNGTIRKRLCALAALPDDAMFVVLRRAFEGVRAEAAAQTRSAAPPPRSVGPDRAFMLGHGEHELPRQHE